LTPPYFSFTCQKSILSIISKAHHFNHILIHDVFEIQVGIPVRLFWKVLQDGKGFSSVDAARRQEWDRK
jgi:hypothetical protein